MINKKAIALLLSFGLILGIIPQYQVLAFNDTGLISVTASENKITVSGKAAAENENISIILTEQTTTRDDISAIETDEDLVNRLKNFYITESVNYNFEKTLSTEELSDDFKIIISSENMLLEENISKNKISECLLENYEIDEQGGITVWGSSAENAQIYILDESLFEGDPGTATSDENIEKYIIKNVAAGSGEYNVTIGNVFYNVNTVALCVKSGDEKIVYKVESNYIHVGNNIGETGNGTIARPFSSIETAKEYLRENKSNREMFVIIHGGRYEFEETVVFDENDGATEDRPITYKAAEGEDVIFTGARVIENSFFEIPGDDVKARLKGAAADNAVMLDLSKIGVNFDFVSFMNEGNNQLFRYLNIFLNDKRQDIAGWPNGEKFKITSVTKGSDVTTDRYLEIDGLDTSKWQYSDNIFIYGCIGNWWNHEWDEIAAFTENIKELKISSYSSDPTAYLGEEYNNPQFTGRVLNVLEEMDIPGEWYLDVSGLKLYYYPPHKLTDEDTFEIAVFDDDFININECQYINFKGINFEKNASKSGTINTNKNHSGHALSIENSENINIENCKIRHIGMSGINADGRNILIDRCVISDVGHCGISVGLKGCREELTETGIVISNNIISDVARERGGNGSVGIYLRDDNVGTVVKNNIVHNTKNIAVRYGGLGNKIQYNEIYNVINDSSDSGAIYAGRSWADYGNVIEYNYIHDYGVKDESESPAWLACGIYWDDKHIGNTARFNIIVPNNTYDGYIAHINGGAQNTFQENIFTNSKVGVRYASSAINNTDIGTCEDRVLEIPYNSQIYLEKYPEINNTYTTWKNEGEFYSYNYLKNNFNVGAANEFEGPIQISLWNETNNTTDVSIDYNDEVFVDSSNHDYRVKDEAKAQYCLMDGIPGENFDMDSIGLQSDYLLSDKDKAFELLYPENNANGLTAEKISIVWEKSDFADEYNYFVYSDKEGKNIVRSGSTHHTNVTVEGLEYGKDYYWQVVAKNMSKEINFEEKSEIYRFSTKNNPRISEVTLFEQNISFVAENLNDSEVSFVVIGAVKDGSGKLLAVNTESFTIPEKVTLEKSIFLNYPFVSDKHKIEFYVWQDLVKMNPIICKTTLR